MLNLTSYIHRKTLRDILARWLMDRFDPGDCHQLKEITNFNSHLLTLYLNDLCRKMFENIGGSDVSFFEIGHKASLKDFITLNPPYCTARIEEILAHYRKYPQDYYRHAPFHGVIYHTGHLQQPTYLGHSRIKRTRRIAEKGARRVIDFIFQRIKTQADRLAEERAGRLGIPKNLLVTDPQTQLSEFVHAERRVIKSIRNGLLGDTSDDTPMLRINDVAGLKVILDDDDAYRLYDHLNESKNIEIVEIERHEGNYNATNLIIKLQLDKSRLASMQLDERVARVLARRGMGPGDLQERFRRFILEGDDEVYLEVILSNYAEMVESELGRCMHEERVLAQRLRQEYRSPLAHNVRYLIEFMFLFTMSPQTRIQDIPIKLWERYMPDTFDEAIKELWDIPVLPAL